MQRNQSFFASASHLYIYDNLLSSRAKVRQNFGTSKLFLKKSLPRSIVFSPPSVPPPGDGNLRRRGVRTCGKPLPSFGGVGGGLSSLPLGGLGWVLDAHIGDDEFRCYLIANDMQAVVFQIMGMTLRRGKVYGRNLHFKVLKILRRAEFIERFLCAPINQLVNDTWGIFIGTHEFVCNPADTIANIFYIDCNFARPRKYHGGIPFGVADANVPTFDHRLSGSTVSKL